jgi:hypothetical protein
VGQGTAVLKAHNQPAGLFIRPKNCGLREADKFFTNDKFIVKMEKILRINITAETNAS